MYRLYIFLFGYLWKYFINTTYLMEKCGEKNEMVLQNLN